MTERGIYSRKGLEALDTLSDANNTENENVTLNTCRDQNAPIFERVTEEEMEAVCKVDGDQVKIKLWLTEGIVWLCGDAGDPELVDHLSPQDTVVANRFLCHMDPVAAERCLRNVARLVKPGGYLFVSAIDLDVRTTVARSMCWKPVSDRMKEVHEGDGFRLISDQDPNGRRPQVC